MELLGLGTALKILFTKDVLSTDMFERNEILALIVTLGKYSDAIQFIEEMEQQIELNKLKANIQGYVDIDNEMKNVVDTKENDINEEFDKLLNNTFKEVFERNNNNDDEGDIGGHGCKEWQLFCSDDRLNGDQHELKQMAIKVCGLYDQYCTN